MMKKLPVHVKLTIRLYLLLLAIYFCFRLTLFFLNINRLGDGTFWEIIQAFIMGVRFDVATIGFAVAIPTVALSVFAFFGRKSRRFEKIYTVVLTVIFTLTFFTCSADIPYFNQFFDRFNYGAFEWINTGDAGFVFKMIFQEPTYFLMLIPVAAAGFVFYHFTNRMFKNSTGWESIKYIPYSIYTILLWGLIFIGMRGRLNEKSPMMVGTAYFCNNALLNQLGLNPNYTLARSWLDTLDEDNKSVRFMPDEEAISNVGEIFELKNEFEGYPLAREVVTDGEPNNYNVIVVIMEGMSINKTAHGGNTMNLTPFLDSLADKSLFFSNHYTSGTHTYCGIYSTLMSYPVVFRQLPFKHTPILQYDGIASVLQKNGYSTTYFTTHDSEFDNIGGFLTENGFERIVSQSDYPAHEVKTTLGVPDDFMFRFSIPIINELAGRGKPFFVTMLTASDHSPFYLPDYFTPRSSELKYQMTEYADYSLETFITLTSQQSWFDNTLFVFVADHGAVFDSEYSIALSYLHTPLLFFMPSEIQPETSNAIASQMDIFPTIMGKLNIPYTNNTFGINLLKESRDFAYFMVDDKYGIINDDWLFINKPADEQKGLYKYREKDTKNYISEFPKQAETMQKYGESNWQLSDYLLNKKKTKILLDK